MTDQQSTYNEELYLIKDKTTVILARAWNDIGEPERGQLQKILQALKLSLASVRIIHQDVLDLAQLNPRPDRVIYFGDAVPGLAQYEYIKSESAIVLAPHLSVLINDDAGKKKLWIALKQLFGL
jgi:hypothetical protein